MCLQQILNRPMKTFCKLLVLFLLAVFSNQCQRCYKPQLNEHCGQNVPTLKLHMTVHPHLDAYWIYDFDTYFDTKHQKPGAQSYFWSNHFSTVKQIFNTAKDVLWASRSHRLTVENSSQQGYRRFCNSQMGFFKTWYFGLDQGERQKVSQLIKSGFWQILGGGLVQQDQGCAYYDDMILNFETGLRFLKEELNYYPRIAIAADAFGHSQSTLAMLAHIGIEGYLVERSDQHILLQNKTEFIWRAVSANNRSYGALPTHIRWAIHGFEDQFLHYGDKNDFCQIKEPFMANLRRQNKFLRRLLNSSHGIRYFGHDFQKFDDYSYQVIEHIMEQFSKQKCPGVMATYGNPTDYFITLMGEVFSKKVKPVLERKEDIFPIWDFDSGLYWTGYYTTDAFHKKNYRDLGRLLQSVRKMSLPLVVEDEKKLQVLREVQQQVGYLQHHDGITGTSKYTVMDQLEEKNQKLVKKLKSDVIQKIFEVQFSPKGEIVFECFLGQNCKIPQQASQRGNIIGLKVLNPEGTTSRNLWITLPFGQYWIPNCRYHIMCLCQQKQGPCRLYILDALQPYALITLKKLPASQPLINYPIYRFQDLQSDNNYGFNKSHITITLNGKAYSIGYKRVEARGISRSYQHLSRFGDRSSIYVTINSGKYALGNDPTTARDLSEIKYVHIIKAPQLTVVVATWKRYGMKTVVTIPSQRPNEWTVETISATQGYYLSDLYLQVASNIDNKKTFFTDSNGWLVMKRRLFKHQDYFPYFQQHFDDINGNTYPATSFTYIQDSNDKLSINLDRAQGVIALKPGTLWVNFDRLSSDDGKWVYESAYRSEYQKYVHVITVQNKDNNERRIQKAYDLPLIVQGAILNKETLRPVSSVIREKWQSYAGINNVKWTVSPLKNRSALVRIHNLKDTQKATVSLFASNVSPLLTAFYGKQVQFAEVNEMSMGGNMKYSQFLQRKWNWPEVVTLKKDNLIFNKVFGQNITLQPLEVRTFMFSHLNFTGDCKNVQTLKFSKQQVVYSLNCNKQSPKRDSVAVELEEKVDNYLRFKDHCTEISPISKQETRFPMHFESMMGSQVPSNFQKIQNEKASKVQESIVQKKIEKKQVQSKDLKTNKGVFHSDNFSIRDSSATEWTKKRHLIAVNH